MLVTKFKKRFIFVLAFIIVAIFLHRYTLHKNSLQFHPQENIINQSKTATLSNSAVDRLESPQNNIETFDIKDSKKINPSLPQASTREEFIALAAKHQFSLEDTFKASRPATINTDGHYVLLPGSKPYRIDSNKTDTAIKIHLQYPDSKNDISASKETPLIYIAGPSGKHTMNANAAPNGLIIAFTSLKKGNYIIQTDYDHTNGLRKQRYLLKIE